MARTHTEAKRECGAGNDIETVRLLRPGKVDHKRKYNPEGDIMTSHQAAEYLQMHYKTVGRLAAQGVIPGRKVGAHWRFSRKALNRWIEEY